MAEAQVLYRFRDGGSVRFTLRSKADHPDALDMLATRALRMLAEYDTTGELSDGEAES